MRVSQAAIADREMWQAVISRSGDLPGWAELHLEDRLCEKSDEKNCSPAKEKGETGEQDHSPKPIAVSSTRFSRFDIPERPGCGYGRRAAARLR